MPPSVFDILAEQRIAEAIRRGEFDNLPGAGRPLHLDDEPLVSPEQRMANRILKNAGFAPAEIMLRREIAALRGQLADSAGSERDDIKRRLAQLVAALGMMSRR
ncbi:DUF1992 domain-containing protein [Aromatoleum bremense]|uniref:DUF1992 domain-containing protein n=1 Tax=Aromatoleum bremense TaxID=76115 RepID=A0ABX1NS68_9RHOO|nr:DUF1992 domain-containing protein [Aromatoleum bremense]NMG14826.1 DUF1992 domain-containing protein [Aromatoleum bremense]QTQ32171.1 putative protein DUF1992 [Aromatoleum bremense]